MQREMAHEMPLPPIPLGGARSLLCPFYVYVIQKRILKNGQIHHCSVIADNLACANFKKEYLKTNLLYWSSYTPMHVGSGQEQRAVYFTDRAPSSSQSQTVLGSESGYEHNRVTLGRLHIILFSEVCLQVKDEI